MFFSYLRGCKVNGKYPIASSFFSAGVIIGADRCSKKTCLGGVSNLPLARG